MGLEYYTTQFLLEAKAAGTSFGRTLTIGRQNFAVHRPQLEKLAGRFGFDSAAFLNAFPPADLVYVEPFFKRILGASVVESIDASSYEGSTHVHDMNTDIPGGLKGRFDAVFEAGSLEHIFNFPIAIRNLMEAVKVGGSLFIQTPANNYFGHGFYQFSPELFYRVLSPANGFEVKRMSAFEHFFPCHFFASKLYSVADPEIVRKRVQLVNKRPTLLLIEARRITEKPIFQSTPQQSDYVQLWQTSSVSATPIQPTCLQNSAKQRLYALPLKWVGSLFFQYLINRGNKPSLANREFFRPEN